MAAFFLDAGFEPLFLVERDPRHAETYPQNHPPADSYSSSVEGAWNSLRSCAPLGQLTTGKPLWNTKRAAAENLEGGAGHLPE
jgi:site-specific DNA-cytosine methylase